jgi:uncharacterized membrane protein (DUF373 family)
MAVVGVDAYPWEPVSRGNDDMHHGMQNLLKRLERMLLVILTGMMALVLVLATAELGYILIIDIFRPPFFILEIDELLEIFGLFLLVLIGIELLDTMKAYMVEKVVHVEIVFAVALIAVARKVIVLDVAKYPSLTLMAIGVIIIALSIGYYLIKRIDRPK